MENDKNYFKIFSRPVLFLGLLLLVAGIFSYTRMQTNLFPEGSWYIFLYPNANKFVS